MPSRDMPKAKHVRPEHVTSCKGPAIAGNRAARHVAPASVLTVMTLRTNPPQLSAPHGYPTATQRGPAHDTPGG